MGNLDFLFFTDPNFVKHLNYRFSHDYLSDRSIKDVFSGSVYKSMLHPNGFLGKQNSHNLSFSFYTDGVNPFKSSKKQTMWPIFLMINELPPQLR